MNTIDRCLAYDGLFLLHTIGGNGSVVKTNEWIEKYIFPNGMVPSMGQISSAVDNRFIIEDWHNFGRDYDATLMAWYNNFKNNWGELQSQYDERFFRMWEYYLLSCAGVFRARDCHVWQLVMSRPSYNLEYQAQR